MPTRKPKPQHGVQSIEVGGRLLQVLAETSRPMMLRDLALTAGMPAPQAHRYLVSFVRMGLVEQVAENGHYDLGPFALQLGLSALARVDAVAIAAPELAALSRSTSQTVALAVWANHGATIVRWLSSDAPVSASLRIGSVMPLTRSATGGIFLAFLARSVTAEVLDKELRENARHGITPTTESELEPVMRQTRQRGAAHVSDFIPGIAGVSAPVLDHTGGMVLALTALGYSKPFDAEVTSVTRAVMDAASKLSRRLGYRQTA
jgi:DNA-binding IclR family transcriptional regulator